MFLKISSIYSTRKPDEYFIRHIDLDPRFSISTPFKILHQSKKKSDVDLKHLEYEKANQQSTETEMLCVCLQSRTFEAQAFLTPVEKVNESKIRERSSCSPQEYNVDQTNRRKPLEKLINSITKLFTFIPLEIDDLDMSQSEFVVLKDIINRKFAGSDICRLINQNMKNLSKDEIIELINQETRSNTSSKRIEENNKFVFKYTFKYLKHQFYGKYQLDKSNSSELLFYEHYFKSISENLKIPLNYFFDPLYKICNKNLHFKSINNKYLGLIFSSPLFKSDFFVFLKNDFKITYNSIIVSKIKKMFKKLRLELSSDKSGKFSNVFIDRFSEKLRRNKKCKLPWNMREVKCALAQFQSLVYYY